MNKKATAFGLVAVAIVVGAVIFASTNDKKSTDTDTEPASSETTTTPSQTEDNVAEPTTDSGKVLSKVEIKDFAFTPSTITVKVGTKVTWTNNDSASHTVTATTKSADAPDSELLGKGETFTFTFNKVGTYEYACTPHPEMKGKVIVTE